MTILFNGKKGVPQSYKDTTELLAKVGKFNVGTPDHNKRKKK